MKAEEGKRSTIIGGTLSLTLSALTVKILGVIYKIPLAGLLGEEGMGYFNSAYTVYGFFYLLCTAGVPKAVMILTAESEDPAARRRTARVATRAFLFLGIAVTALFMLLSGKLSELIGNRGAEATMLAVAPSIIFISVAGVVRGALNAEMKLMDVAISQLVEGVGKLALGLVFAVVGHRLGLSLELISAFTILGVTLGAFFGMLYLLGASKVKISDKKQRQKVSKTEKHLIIKRIFSISLPITFSAAVMSITNVIDLALIMRRLEGLGYSELEASTLYGNYTTLAVPMLNLAISIVTPVSVAFLPVFTRARAGNDRMLLSRALGDSIRLSSALSAPLFVGISAFSAEILTMLFPDMDIRLGAPLLCLLMPALVFATPLLILNSALEANGFVKAPVISMLVGSALKLLVSFLLLGNEDFGISGAPIGTVVSYAAGLSVSLILCHRRAGLKPSVITSSVLPYIAAFGSVGLSRLLYSRLPTGARGSLSLVVTVLLCAAAYMFLLYLFGVLSKDKLSEMSKYTKSL